MSTPVASTSARLYGWWSKTIIGLVLSTLSSNFSSDLRRWLCLSSRPTICIPQGKMAMLSRYSVIGVFCKNSSHCSMRLMYSWFPAAIYMPIGACNFRNSSSILCCFTGTILLSIKSPHISIKSGFWLLINFMYRFNATLSVPLPRCTSLIAAIRTSLPLSGLSSVISIYSIFWWR